MNYLNKDFKANDSQQFFIIAALEVMMEKRAATLKEMAKELQTPVRDAVMGYVLGDYFKAAKLLNDMQARPDGSPAVKPLQPVAEDLAVLQALIDEHSRPELALLEGHVLQFWSDAEVTSQKAGELLWQRTLHTSQPGFPGITFDVKWPTTTHKGYGYIFTDGAGITALRAAYLDLTLKLI